MRLDIALFVTAAAFAAGCRGAGGADHDDGSHRAAAHGLTIPADVGSPPLDEAEDEPRLLIDDGTGVRSVAPPPAEVSYDAGKFPLVGKPLPVQASGSVAVPEKQAVVELAAQRSPAELMPLTFILTDEPANWKAFRETKVQANRDAFIQTRLAALTSGRAAFLAWLTANGALGVRPLWLANIVHARLPAGKVSAAIARPEVVDVARNGGAIIDDGIWTGKESTDAVRISQLYAAGIRGRPGGRFRPRVQVAIIEQTLPYRAHVAWNSAAGATRLRFLKDCTNGVSCLLSSASATTSTHATGVGAIAAESIENGQDPVFPGTSTVDQREHSGHLADSYIHFYRIDSDDDVPLAVQQAVTDGADVINMSFSLPSTDGCSRFSDAAGLNQVLQTALHSGAVVVKSAGNGGVNPGCTLGYPANRPQTLAINGVDTATTTQAYENVPILASASRGGVTIRTHSNWLATASRLDAVVPGKLIGFLAPPGNSYSTSYFSGSSVAAPVATGVVGAIRSAFAANGWPTGDARLIMANTLLMGDGWDSDSGLQTIIGMSTRSGAGRLKTHWPSSVDLAGTWGWGMRAVTITQGQTVTWPVGSGGPMPAGVTQWKWAVVWTPLNMDDVPDIDFYVDDLCGGGGIVASDTGYDVRGRFRLGQSSITGRCLQMRAVGYSVPPGGVTFYSADYFHSGATGAH